MIFVCYFQKKVYLRITSKHQCQKYTLSIKCNINIIWLYIYIYIYMCVCVCVCIYHCRFDKVDLFYGKLNTNLQLNTNMKVDSNLLQHVSSSREGSVAIPQEFPSRIIQSTHWFYKPRKCPRTIYFLARGLQVTSSLGGSC